jgi:hypothetical protein
MENYLYTCQYCGKDYKPNRRKKQKYCSNSCRTRAFVVKKGNVLGLSKPEIQKKENNKIESMSFAGVGNAAVGTLAINVLSNFLTSEENKPATKKDIKEVKDLLISKYHIIKNMQPDSFGNLPYYDIESKSVVYLIKPMSHGDKKY